MQKYYGDSLGYHFKVKTVIQSKNGRASTPLHAVVSASKESPLSPEIAQFDTTPTKTDKTNNLVSAFIYQAAQGFSSLADKLRKKKLKIESDTEPSSKKSSIRSAQKSKY